MPSAAAALRRRRRRRRLEDRAAQPAAGGPRGERAPAASGPAGAALAASERWSVPYRVYRTVRLCMCTVNVDENCRREL